MPYVYIGRKINQCGKTLWDQILNLKNFGEGRMFIRGFDQLRYKEPCYFRIVKASPLYSKFKTGEIQVEEVFKGRPLPGLIDITSQGFKPNYQLIPKHEEHKFISAAEEITRTPIDVQIFAKMVELPPLMKLWAQRKGYKTEMNLCLEETDERRIAKEGETPNTKMEIGLGIPLSPHLYDHLKEIQPTKSNA